MAKNPKLSRISTFPIHRPFEKQEPTSPLTEVILRLVVNIYSNDPYVIGTATILTGNVLISAKHVLDLVWNERPNNDGAIIEINKHLAAVQTMPGPEYIIWDIVDGIADPTSDLVLLRLGTNPSKSNFEKSYEWRHPRLNPFSPDIGENIAAFGYRKSTIQVTKNAQGDNHIDLNDELISSVGIVRQIYEMRRDAMLPFPCYQVSARFDAGMSGGAVFDESGCLCGIVCSNIQDSHLTGEPISYVTTLWPLFRLMLNWDRGNKYPRAIKYPAIELARSGHITVPNIERLEEWFTQHIAS